MEMIDLIIVAVVTGVLTKLVDIVEEHNPNLSENISLISGVIYGILIGYVISFSPELSGLWIAIVLSVLITRKIDSRGHYLGIISMIIFVLVFGWMGTNILYIIIFTPIGVLEELINDKFVDKGKIKNKRISTFFTWRPLIEISVFIVSVMTGQWIIWLGILSYDIGYILIEFLMRKRIRP